jgi:hypothetical protein
MAFVSLLSPPKPPPPPPPAPPPPPPVDVEAVRAEARAEGRRQALEEVREELEAARGAMAVLPGLVEELEIGRASCRERVS